MIRYTVGAASALLLGVWLTGSAQAQGFSGPFEGFSTGSDQPIQIEADRLEIRDPEKLAIYTGNVRVQQGGTTLKTTELRVHYTGEAKEGVPGSSVDRIEAGTPVVIQSGDQTATGDRALLEMSREIVTLSGNVVINQADNVARGQSLVVNLKTKEAQLQGGRVQTVISPRSGQARQ